MGCLTCKEAEHYGPNDHVWCNKLELWVTKYYYTDDEHPQCPRKPLSIEPQDDPPKRYIQSKEEAKMFALFLASERNRHLEDVANAEKDLKALEDKWGITVDYSAKYFTVT